jgi:hypothetical protein
MSTSSPLSQIHVEMIREAVSRSRKIRRAAAVASGSGWTLLLFALPALAFGFVDIASAGLGAMLLVIAWGEFKGAGALRKLDPRAPGRLVLNQILLGLALCGYGVWGIVNQFMHPNPAAAELIASPEVQQMLGPINEYVKFGVIGFYGLFVALSFLATLGTALYYKSRAKFIKNHLTTIPQWIIDVQRAAA